MNRIFITVLNMSLTATYVAFIVILIRFVLNKTQVPKVFSYFLWAAVLFRLVCPISFESVLSLIPGKATGISQDIVYSQSLAITGGIRIIDNTISHPIQPFLLPIDPAVNVNPMEMIIEGAALIWLMGIVLILSYGMISYLRLNYRISTATFVKDNVFETDRIQTAFVLGLIKPKIYIPVNLSRSEMDYIIKHEQTHIRRYDYIIKPVAFLALVLHWFNPLIWICYFLMAKDMEMSCDERVIKQSGGDVRENYCKSLLSLSAKQSGLFTPLAFGESNVRSRINNVLNYKKPAFWVMVVGVVGVLVLSVGLMTNPKENEETNNTSYKPAIMVDGQIYWLSPGGNINEIPEDSMVIGQLETLSPATQWPDRNYQGIGFSQEFLGADIYRSESNGNIIYVYNNKQKQYVPLEIINENSSVSTIGGEDSFDGKYIYLDTPDAAYQLYKKAIMERDYHTIVALTPTTNPRPDGQEIWDGVKIDEVTVLKKNIRQNKACYALILQVADGGDSDFPKGAYPRWLLLVKDEKGWYVEGLAAGGEPPESWWTNEKPLENVFPNRQVVGKVNLLISPSNLDTRNHYYYVPANQQQLSNMIDQVVWKQIKRFPVDSYRLGITIVQDNVSWDMLSNGSFYYWEDHGLEYKGFQGENPQLYHEILNLLREDLQFAPFTPTQIVDIVAAEIVYNQYGSDKTYAQRITNSKALKLVEKRFRLAKPMGEITGCPFNEAVMTLEKKDGTTILIRLASDSCPIYFVNGNCFDYGGDNREILSLFDEIPWRI